MSAQGATAAFVDTGAFYARFDGDDQYHRRAVEVFEAIRDGDLPYRPLYTSSYVLAELAGLLTKRDGVPAAVTALRQVRNSPRVEVLYPGEGAFDAAILEFDRYDDTAISLVDHLSGVLADDRDVEYVFTFDEDDFRAVGVRCVPADVEVP